MITIFKVQNGSSQSEHVDKIKDELNQILEDFYKNDYNLILISHGNSIGIILKYFLTPILHLMTGKRLVCQICIV